MDEREEGAPLPEAAGTTEAGGDEASIDEAGRMMEPAADQPDDRNEGDATPDVAADEAQADSSLQRQQDDDAKLTEFELNEMIEGLCNSKAEEFRMIGYEHVTGREVWDCVSDKYEKKGYPQLHQIVNDILSLKSTQFMNWMTMSIYKNAQF